MQQSEPLLNAVRMALHAVERPVCRIEECVDRFTVRGNTAAPTLTVTVGISPSFANRSQMAG